jgi:hypothetical protein
MHEIVLYFYIFFLILFSIITLYVKNFFFQGMLPLAPHCFRSQSGYLQ